MADVHPSEDQIALVQRIVALQAPQATAQVFRSRATGRRLKRLSDLDLLLESAEPLPLTVRANLREAFSASDLPFRVDLVEGDELSPAFAAALEAALEAEGLVPLNQALPAHCAAHP